jgi:hypothetical protein
MRGHYTCATAITKALNNSSWAAGHQSGKRASRKLNRLVMGSRPVSRNLIEERQDNRTLGCFRGLMIQYGLRRVRCARSPVSITAAAPLLNPGADSRTHFLSRIPCET